MTVIENVMIQEYVESYYRNKETLALEIKANLPKNYQQLVTMVFKMLADDECVNLKPDITKIREIDDGVYQGTLIYIAPEITWQPSTYIYCKIWYGSCSGCDTIQGILESKYSEEIKCTEYMMLALHIIQKTRIM